MSDTPKDNHEFIAVDSCDLMNSSHTHSEGMSRIKCSCGWVSNPVPGKSAPIFFQCHVMQALNTVPTA